MRTTMPFAGAYRGTRVLVTGHTGFMGAWLSQWLLRLGADVTGFSMPAPTQPSLFEDARLARDLRSITGDVRDADAVLGVMRSVKPDVVFHLAAQAHVLPSYADPLGTFSTNVMGTAHVLDAVRRVGRPGATVVVTTDKSYETNAASPPHPETDRLGGADPYSASKASAELVTRAYRSSYDLPAAGHGLATLRAGNIVGGGDWSAHRIIPDCARALSRSAPIVLRHASAVRPWHHVLDAVSGCLLLGSRLLVRPVLYSDAWNFGPDPSRPYTVMEAVEAFTEAWAARDHKRAVFSGRIPAGYDIEHAEDAPLFEQPTLRVDTEKARTRLGWEPLLDFHRTIEWSADWYWRHRFEPRFDAQVATLGQIADYEQVAEMRELEWA
jgi:CDP-glucose 4,6-dehydratase